MSSVQGADNHMREIGATGADPIMARMTSR
jgi:hypothetical protein